jgi:hypothetical protein
VLERVYVMLGVVAWALALSIGVFMQTVTIQQDMPEPLRTQRLKLTGAAILASFPTGVPPSIVLAGGPGSLADDVRRVGWHAHRRALSGADQCAVATVGIAAAPGVSLAETAHAGCRFVGPSGPAAGEPGRSAVEVTRRMVRTVARWLIEHDPDATRRCFALLPVGTGCGCNQCRNFEAAAGRTFPADFIALADALGVDPSKPADLCHWCREPSGLYLTGGWFHLVGSIVAGEDLIHEVHGTGRFQFEELVPGLEFGFTTRLALVPPVFAGLPVLQLEFQARVPWVLTDPEPEAEPGVAPDHRRAS